MSIIVKYVPNNFAVRIYFRVFFASVSAFLLCIFFADVHASLLCIFFASVSVSFLYTFFVCVSVSFLCIFCASVSVSFLCILFADVLAEYNTELYGGSTGSGPRYMPGSNLNVAEPGAKSQYGQ